MTRFLTCIIVVMLSSLQPKQTRATDDIYRGEEERMLGFDSGYGYEYRYEQEKFCAVCHGDSSFACSECHKRLCEKCWEDHKCRKNGAHKIGYKTT